MGLAVPLNPTVEHPLLLQVAPSPLATPSAIWLREGHRMTGQWCLRRSGPLRSEPRRVRTKARECGLDQGAEPSSMSHSCFMDLEFLASTCLGLSHGHRTARRACLQSSYQVTGGSHPTQTLLGTGGGGSMSLGSWLWGSVLPRVWVLSFLFIEQEENQAPGGEAERLFFPRSTDRIQVVLFLS